MKFFQLNALLLGVVVMFGANTNASAQQISLSSETDQTAVELSAIDNPEAVRALVSRLSDSEVRDLLLQQLDVVAEKQNTESDTDEVSLFSLVTTSIPIAVGAAVENFPNMISDQAEVFLLFIKSLEPGGWLRWLGVFFTAIAAGILVEYLVRQITQTWRSIVDESSSHHSLLETLKILFRRLILDLSGLIAFIVVSQFVIEQLVDPGSHYITHHMLWNLVLIPRLFSVVLKFAFAPQRSDLRLIHTSDASAKFLHRHLVGVALLVGIFLSVIDLQGVPGAEHIRSRIGFVVNLVIHLYFAFIAWRSRFALIDIINGKDDDATSRERTVARLYPYYALLVIVSSWILVEVLGAQGKFDLIANGVQYSTMFILLLAPIMDTVVRGLVKHLTPEISGEGAMAQQAYESTKRSYIRIGRLLVVLFVLAWLTWIWEVDLADMNTADIGTIKTQRFISFIG